MHESARGTSRPSVSVESLDPSERFVLTPDSRCDGLLCNLFVTTSESCGHLSSSHRTNRIVRFRLRTRKGGLHLPTIGLVLIWAPTLAARGPTAQRTSPGRRGIPARPLSSEASRLATIGRAATFCLGSRETSTGRSFDRPPALLLTSLGVVEASASQD